MKFHLIIDKEKEEQVVATVHTPSALTAQLEALVLSYTGSDRIPVFREEEMLYLPFAQISCITVLEGKTWVIDSSGKQYRVKLRLYELEALLPQSFFRINKSTIANQTQLDRFTSNYAGAICAHFKCGFQDYVSRRCFSVIKRRFAIK